MCVVRTAILIVLCVFVIPVVVDSAKVRHHSTGRQALKFVKNRGGIGATFGQGIATGDAGLWPNVFNVATKAVITVNATCGKEGREEFCRLSEGARGRCGICDNSSTDPGKRHPIHFAIDGTNKWWQSPPLYYGPEYEFVTITLDLKQIYQVAYIIIKAANSPRPGSWILERSLDGKSYHPWQYFATNDKECVEKYGTPATKGKPHYATDTEVICTTYYSRLSPMENGEIHTWLVHGRPGANETSPELLEFTKARYVRLRFQGFRGSIEPIPKWLSQDILKDKRLFYSIRDISIGGQCVCNGHAANCRHNVASGHPECECAHHTCGSNCDRCCPLYNQRKWGAGSSRDSRHCLACNCHGHADSCHYDASTDRDGLSIDANGNYKGGGVCENCTAHTTGTNCERCITGYYRPYGRTPDSEIPCVKCSCDPLGSTGICSVGADGPLCECRPGYGGMLCDACAPGYRGYPNCEVCPCDDRGVVPNNDCEQDCRCKVNVEGQLCDRCKPGHFALHKTNREGCYACFCSRVTTLCETAAVIQRTFETLDEWYVSDISATHLEKPTLDERNMLSIGNYEIPGIESYYWLAPKSYLGNKLEIYASNFVFKIHWVVMRGDTSGKPTTGPNLIMMGANGMRIAHGKDFYTGTNMTFSIPLLEDGWFHIIEDEDIATRLRSDDYEGDSVTRSQFLSVLTDVKHVMLRAKFHADQIEVSLEQAVLKVGEDGDGYGAVERCSCPSGYTGLSCETCDYGYVRVNTNTTDHHEQGFCVKCDCNGHSKTCDADTAQCFCEHNTVGETCNRCVPGFYGNALIGTPDDCRQCACPLIEEENNFSPSCQLDSLSLSNDDDEPGYVCTQCPKGYTGDHCEICDDGYFGLPTKPGGSCQPCSCSGNPCDRITGQCLGCKGNTEGWKCERCKSGYFGDPTTSNCQACLCDSFGSMSDECDNTTGQCVCKDKVIGRTCDRCMDRFGNMTASCTPCDCNTIGSRSDICDPRTGLCDCQPGIEGFHCDACQHLHFGFGESGCQSCNCNSRGSEIPTCDIKTGNCRCKPKYIGRTCDQCEGGYWESSTGCVKCQCDSDGSTSINCDRNSGYCNCKPGVGGEHCDNCLPGYYNFTNTGCTQCKECRKPNHICDPDTGDCVCPRHSCGTKCTKCCPYSWGYKPYVGCEPCACSQEGSTSQQCDVTKGTCHCRLGYAGDKCNRCAHGYYGYPKCRRCNCNLSGTDRNQARCDVNGVCQCNDDGSCVCKENVQNRNCNECKDGTFGLHVDNPSGCTPCFCFGRSTICKDAQLTWGQIRTNSTRELDVSNTPNGRTVISGDTIKGRYGNVTVSPSELEDWRRRNLPLYWRLHEVFKGDRILSYSGYIRFMTETFGSNYPPQRSERYPLVKLFGNGITLHYYPSMPPPIGRHEVRFHESLWQDGSGNKKVHRGILMMVLQNITDIHIKATDSSNFNKLIIHEVTLDTAIEVKGTPPPLAIGVEICECPPQYNSSSCQDPSIGHYRDRTKQATQSAIFDKVVGKAEPCRCNGRSKICDIESGRCLNCANSTSGHHCEKCAEGFYGNPMIAYGSCKPCPCPTPEHNFALGCLPGQPITCYCKPGYEGPKCNKCSRGYYGHPSKVGGSCMPCDCNRGGIVADKCDSSTGQCECKQGITGRQCSKCEKARHILENNACIPCDDCAQKLLDQIDQLSKWLHGNTSHLLDGKIEPPWHQLTNMEDRFVKQHDRYKKFDDDAQKAKKLIDKANLHHQEDKLGKLGKKFEKTKMKLDAVQKNGNEMAKKAVETLVEMEEVNANVQTLLEMLSDFGKSHVSVKEAVQEGTDLLKLLEEKSNAIKKMQDRNNVLKKCQEIGDFLENVNSKRLDGQADDLEEKLKKANEFLNDLEKILTKINVKLADTKAKNLNNMNRIVALAGKIEKLKIDTDIVGKESERKNKILNETAAILNSTQNIFNTLKNDADFKKLLKMLHNKEKYMEKNLPTLEKHLAKVTDHASQLNKNIAKYMQMLSLDEKELSAVNASKAYSNVIELLEEANMVADDADQQLRNTKLIILPNDADSIFVNTTICDADSKRLEARINMIKNKIPDYDEKYMGLQLKMEKLKNQNWDNGMNNTGQSKRLQEIKDELSNEIDTKKLIREAIAHSEKMKNVYRTAMEINISTQYDLARTFQKHLNLTSQNKIEMLRNQIKLTKELLQNTFVHNQTNLDLIKTHNRNFSNFYVKNSSISAKLDELRAKIQKSKEIADGIRVSLSGPNCSRSYRLNDLEPTLITNLTVTFEYMNPKKPTSLFYLSNDKKQYMNLKIADGLISFQVSLSGSVVELSHPTPLLENTYYNVNVERISHKIKMSVDNSFVEKEIGSTVFKTNPSDLIKMGDAPRALGLPGCVREVIFNRRTIGFWNFETSAGSCFGCIRNNTNIINDANPNSIFNGAGYSLIHKQRQDKSVKPDKIRVSFGMRTFDENALLFLAPHPEGGTYMAVTLNHGHIQFTMHYKKAEPIILKTKERYNNGKAINIEIVKVYDKGKKMDEAILVVKKETTNGTREVPIREILKVKQVYYYFGGVPPDFLINSKDATASLNTHQSLLGIISNCNADQLFTLHETTNYQQHYGVEKSDGDLEFRKVWFEGQGHLTLKTTKLVPDYSIAFLIRTNQSSAFVMDVENVASFRVQSGKIAVSVIHKKKKISLSSASAIDDDDYHLIELVFKSNLTLSVDGVEEHVEKIKSAKVSVGNEEQMIYMGGLDNSDEARFNGEISDIIVDGRLVKFNAETVINFEKAKIGRGLSTKKKRAASDQKDENENLLRITNDNIKDMQRTEGCDMAINPYVLEPNAVKFGDRPESYVKYNWKELLWKEDFSLEFEFRTFYKAGMLLFAQGETMKEHYNLIDVKEGKIVVIVAGRRKKIFEPTKKVDDGEWHKIVIVIKTNKKKRRLTVIVDDKKEKAKKIPLNKVSGDVFVGGLPKDVQHKMPKSSKLQPFRGCVRGLKLNGEQQGFQNHHKINVCFPKIEKGSYFNGDAHAIYDRNFRVQEHLEFNFEFRTAEQNGILLSVSTPNNNPALSVELQNGAVVMSVDMGNGVVSNVTNYLSEYALCNNRWHNVTALFSSELTVNVDGVSKSWVISEGGFMDDIDDPLYIGGLPDTAPEGTLKTRENFKGCIRNVKIGNSKTDWVDMAELNNVSLNSCPIV